MTVVSEDPPPTELDGDHPGFCSQCGERKGSDRRCEACMAFRWGFDV